MPAVLQQRTAPQAIGSLTPLSYDYVDLFSISTEGATRSAEQWTRTALEGSPRVRVLGPLVWQVLLGLRMDRRAVPDRIAGWKVAERADEWLRLEAASWFMTAHIVVHVDEQLAVATFVRYDRWFGAAFWPRVAAVHRRAMPRILRFAVRSMLARERCDAGDVA